MFPLSTKGAGMCFAFPDVCKIPAPPGPPVPTPFPNLAQCADADGGTCSDKVRVQNKRVLHANSIIPRSSGDEAGVLKGVVSSTQMDQVRYRSSHANVQIEGNAAVTLMSQTAQNGSNANAPAGMQVAPSQTKVLIG